MGKGYKEESMDQKKRKTFKNMKERRNDLCILALYLWIFIIFHALFWCLRVAVMWRVCGKAKGRLRVRMWPGDPVLLTAWRWDPWCPLVQGLPRDSVFQLCNEKVGCWHPTSYCHPQLVYMWPGMRPCQPVPHLGGHCLHASLLTTLLASFFHCFLSLPFSFLSSSPCSLNLQPALEFSNVDTLEEGT